MQENNLKKINNNIDIFQLHWQNGNWEIRWKQNSNLYGMFDKIETTESYLNKFLSTAWIIITT